MNQSEVERFERSLARADVDRMKRIVERINSDRLDQGLKDVDPEWLEFEMGRSIRRLAAMIVRIPLITDFSATSVQEMRLVGSVDSDKFHLPSCRWAKKISPEKQIWFSSVQDAKTQGYVPCGVCKPT